MTATAPEQLMSVRDWLRYTVSRMRGANVAFGQGFVEAYDEAAYLVLHTLHLPLDRLEPFLDAKLTAHECSRLAGVLERRVTGREPAEHVLGRPLAGVIRLSH